MNCMGRWLKFLFLSFAMVFSLCSAASGQCASANVDVVAFNDLNQDLNDYAVIFEDAGAHLAGCNSTAANALRAKIRNTLPDHWPAVQFWDSGRCLPAMAEWRQREFHICSRDSPLQRGAA